MSDSHGSMFIAEYDKKNFNDQLLRLESFEYQTDVILDSDEYIIPQTSFSIGDWNFKVLKPQSQTQEFPKNIDFVCINTSECKIGYMTFYDEDIDYLCKSGNENEYMKHFVKKYFKYNLNYKNLCVYIFMHIQMTETQKDIIEKKKGNTPPLRIFIIKKIINI